MIVCPKCGKHNCKPARRDVIDPAQDKFRCLECGTDFLRYDGTPYQDKKPENDESK